MKLEEYLNKTLNSTCIEVIDYGKYESFKFYGHIHKNRNSVQVKSEVLAFIKLSPFIITINDHILNKNITGLMKFLNIEDYAISISESTKFPMHRYVYTISNEDALHMIMEYFS